MKLYFANMIMLLSVTMAALSCSKELPPERHESYTIVVSGTASDKADGTPLQDIRIHLYTAELVTNGDVKVSTTEVNTDHKGHYTLTLDGFNEPISCTITASDPDGIYATSQQELRILWRGTSYDEYTGYFYVNDCDFYLEKMLR